MRIAIDDLKLDRLIGVYPGESEYRLAPNLTVAPLAAVCRGDL